MKLEGILLSNPREPGEGEENYQGFLIFPKIALQSGEVFVPLLFWTRAKSVGRKVEMKVED